MIKATYRIDDDKWAKHPYNIVFDDEECNRKFGRQRMDSISDCDRQIAAAKAAGYEIDDNVERVFF